MTSIQSNILLCLAFFSFLVFLKGLYESRKGSSYGDTVFLFFMGIFVWADAIIFGLFWAIVSLLSYLLQDLLLFGLITSLFWLVRSIGETMYWFNQQFSTVVHKNPETQRGYFLVKSDAIWFVYQIFWQCVTVLTIITTLFMAKLWLQN